ncbi:MAG: Asp-tRNA(Asn)/Glu-tRNA(Gln) amidotransferase subunit GatC [Rickettsiales bacterium]|jgi:aspartyl-tRNA(Asn)/glutamyl-tRNA(Gln) amidotransferase subunit C|nr:Asp-tRNA(Asn)/Glu-tRNA(Gln) amidotransferase subunit GatC [Rickettsiales bacterium]
MAFTKQQLQKFAHLIRIELSDEQLEKMQISGVIEWLDKLQNIETQGVVPLLTPAEHDLPIRNDVVDDGNYRDMILANVPDDAGKSRGYFAVPKVIDET